MKIIKEILVWIPYKDENKPKHGEKVLVVNDEGIFGCCWYSNGSFTYADGSKFYGVKFFARVNIPKELM